MEFEEWFEKWFPLGGGHKVGAKIAANAAWTAARESMQKRIDWHVTNQDKLASDWLDELHAKEKLQSENTELKKQLSEARNIMIELEVLGDKELDFYQMGHQLHKLSLRARVYLEKYPKGEEA